MISKPKGIQKMISKSNKIVYTIRLKIDKEEEMTRRINRVKELYDDGWFDDEEIMIQVLKEIIIEYLDFDLVAENENL